MVPRTFVFENILENIDAPAGFFLNHIRRKEVSPRPRERPVIHTSAVWFGQGWAVWVSHPGQVGDRAGQVCGSVRAGHSTAGRAGQLGSFIIAGQRFGISGGEKKGEIIAVNMEFE